MITSETDLLRQLFSRVVSVATRMNFVLRNNQASSLARPVRAKFGTLRGQAL